MQSCGLLVDQCLHAIPIFIPHKAESAHAHWLQISVPGLSVNKPKVVGKRRLRHYLLVISNVVPKIWARTNSAMFARVYAVHVAVAKRLSSSLGFLEVGLGSSGALLRGERFCARAKMNPNARLKSKQSYGGQSCDWRLWSFMERQDREVGPIPRVFGDKHPRPRAASKNPSLTKEATAAAGDGQHFLQLDSHRATNPRPATGSQS